MYKPITVREDFAIRKIGKIQYFEYDKSSCIEDVCGFCKLIYIDKGETEINGRLLTKGDCIIAFPKMRCDIKSVGKTVSRLFIADFECKSIYMDFAKNKIFRLCTADKERLNVIVREFETAFKSNNRNVRNKNAVASEQLIKISLESIVISLYRGNGDINPSATSKERLESELIYSLKEYLKENINEKLKFSDVVNFAKMSPTTIKSVFKKYEGIGVMTCFSNMKIERAKKYIREDNYNFTQISQLLSYDTPHRFTKQFKAKTGMTPTEYAKSVKNAISSLL